MPTILQLRRGTTAENDAYTGSVGELTVDTTLNKVILHDGSTAGGTTVGNLQGNIQIGITGDNEIDTSSGNLTIDSAGGTVTIDDNLVIAGDLTVQGTTTTVNSTTIDVQNSLRFEGATSDAFETNLTVTDPTADRTITLPDATGTVALTSDIPAGYTDSDVDTHLNTSTASSSEVLSWTGSDYDWVAQSAGGGTSWQTVKTSAFTAVAGEGYFVNTTSAAITVTLPASPTLGDEVTIVDYAGTADTNNITVARNSENIQGSAADLTVSVERAAFTLVYTDGTQGWLLKDK